MRFIFLLLLIFFIQSTAVSQSLSGYITKLESEITYAKNNNADPGKIKELEKILEQMRFTQSYLDRGVIPKPKPNTNISPGSSWSGFLSSTREGSTELPVSTRNSQIYLFFSEAVPTLHRNFNENEELNFTDDKGTGTLKDHAVITIGNQTSTCDCSGSGASELHEVVVNLFDSTYTIDALAPVCTGSGDADGSCGLTFSIAISSEKLINPNVLSGSRTVTTEIGGIKATVTNTWYLVRTIDVELIVKPRDYDTWLPEPGNDEKTVGKKPMTVDLELKGKNGKPLKQKAKSFEIMLNYTSREPGITINFPLSPIKNGTPPDLQLLEQPNARIENEAQNMKIDCNSCTSSSFKIGAFDGGAYSTLIAVAVLEDDSRITGHLSVPAGTTEITIPKRNGSMIAEAWKKKYGNPGDIDDKETSSGNSNNGDGLTAYEEYRGVISLDTFRRLSPQQKELGVLLRQSEIGLFKLGLSLFEKESDITVYIFDKNEIPENRRLNQNAKSAHDFNQFVLRLQKGNTGLRDMMGRVLPSWGLTYPAHDIPARVTHIVIDVDRIHAGYLTFVPDPELTSLPFTEKDLIASTTAHEIGHGVDLPHHARIIPYVPDTKAETKPPVIFKANAKRKWEELRRPYILGGGIASPGDNQSGNVSCFMCYRNKCNWLRVIDSNNTLIYYWVPWMPAGSLFCTDKKGTGINANNEYFGDALNGNCLGNIKLRE